MDLNIPRKLDLAAAADRRVLANALDEAGEPEAALWLDDYLVLFDAPAWRQVYVGGLVTGPGDKQGYSIQRLLAAAKQVALLRECAGIDQLKSALRNPSQVDGTLFELDVATWCVNRAVHRALELSPTAGTKRPDVRWTTELGTVWCECKEARALAGQAARQLKRLSVVVGAAHEAAMPWPRESRLDVILHEPRRNGIEKRIATAVRRARFEGNASEGEVEVVIRPRNEVPHFGEALEAMSVTVGSTPTLLGAENAHLRVVLPTTMQRRNHARRLLREARTQLPDEPSAVFLSGLGTGAAVDAAEAQVGAGANLAFVGFWRDQMVASAVYSAGQPFDERLLAPAR